MFAKLYTNTKLRYGATIIFIVALFVVFSIFAQTHTALLERMTQQAGIVGIISYIAIMASAIVVAPIGTLFLIPLASASWGAFLAGVYTVLGWTAGSLIAFYIARKWGSWVLSRTKNIHKLHEIEKALPKRQVFFILVLLRITIPVDVLSYALGLFSKVSYRMFFSTTLIGVTPFTFLLTYAASGSLRFQIFTGVVGLLLFLIGIYQLRKRNLHSKTKTKEEKMENI